MILLASIFALFFIVLVGGGIFVYMFMLTNGAFGEKIPHSRKNHIGKVSLSQTGTIPTAAAAARLYPGKRAHMSTHMRVFILYSLGILLALVVLIVLVLGVTQF